MLTCLAVLAAAMTLGTAHAQEQPHRPVLLAAASATGCPGAAGATPAVASESSGALAADTSRLREYLSLHARAMERAAVTGVMPWTSLRASPD